MRSSTMWRNQMITNVPYPLLHPHGGGGVAGVTMNLSTSVTRGDAYAMPFRVYHDWTINQLGFLRVAGQGQGAGTAPRIQVAIFNNSAGLPNTTVVQGTIQGLSPEGSVWTTSENLFDWCDIAETTLTIGTYWACYRIDDKPITSTPTWKAICATSQGSNMEMDPYGYDVADTFSGSSVGPWGQIIKHTAYATGSWGAVITSPYAGSGTRVDTNAAGSSLMMFARYLVASSSGASVGGGGGSGSDSWSWTG